MPVIVELRSSANREQTLTPNTFTLVRASSVDYARVLVSAATYRSLERNGLIPIYNYVSLALVVI
jgi:hypothetical protein